MLRHPGFWGAVAAMGLAVWLILPHVRPARPPVVSADAAPEIRYVCTETGEVFTRRATAATLPHPVTAKPTLVPAVYDARRKQWRPGPPLEVMHRQGRLRPAPRQ